MLAQEVSVEVWLFRLYSCKALFYSFNIFSSLVPFDKSVIVGVFSCSGFSNLIGKTLFCSNSCSLLNKATYSSCKTFSKN